MDYVNLIEKINFELQDLLLEENKELFSFMEENGPLSFDSVGWAHSIDFFGIQIWSSENDERPCVPWIHDGIEDEEYIPLETWIWQEISRILSLMNQFNEILNKRE